MENFAALLKEFGFINVSVIEGYATAEIRDTRFYGLSIHVDKVDVKRDLVGSSTVCGRMFSVTHYFEYEKCEPSVPIDGVAEVQVVALEHEEIQVFPEA